VNEEKPRTNIRRLERCRLEISVWQPIKRVFAWIGDLGGGALSSLIGSPRLCVLHVISAVWSRDEVFRFRFSFPLEVFTFGCGSVTARRSDRMVYNGLHCCVSDGAAYVGIEEDRQYEMEIGSCLHVSETGTTVLESLYSNKQELYATQRRDLIT